MELPRTILVPTDFGDAADAALDAAIELARRLGATVRVVHAFEPPGSDLPEGMIAGLGDASDRVLDAAEKALANAAEARRGAGVVVETEIVRGRPWRAIVDAAAKDPSALVVMGTHGRAGAERPLLGSVAERVVRASPRPVLTIRAPARSLPPHGT